MNKTSFTAMPAFNKIKNALLLILVTCSLAACNSNTEHTAPTGTIYSNAKVFTANNGAMADTFVVDQGKFIYVGDSAGAQKYRDESYPTVDLGKKVVLPGLHDHHIHLLGTVALDMCDLQSTAVTLDELVTTLTTCLTQYAPHDGDWLVVNQWVPYEGNQPSVDHPTIRAALDAVSLTHPIVLKGTDGHASAYNSAALALAQDADGNTVGFTDISLAPGGVFADFALYVNLESGVVREVAREVIPVPEFTDPFSAPDSEEARAAYSKILPAITEQLARRGITSVNDACANDLERTLFEQLQAQGQLHFMLTLDTCFVGSDYQGIADIPAQLAKAKSVREHFTGNPLIKADTVKIFIDGVLEGDPFADPVFLPNAGMLNNYQTPHLQIASDAISITQNSENSGSNGIVNFTPEVLAQYVTALDANGFNIHMHSIGDRSTRTALDAIAAAKAANGATQNTFSVAHLQIVHPDDQARMGTLGVYLTYTYGWINTNTGYDVLVTPFVEKSVAGQDLNSVLYNASSYSWSATYPVQATRQAGGILVGGSDAPVDSRDPQPFHHIASGITRSAGGGMPHNPGQNATLQQMLEAYTINGARAARIDDKTGSIAVGKSADFIVIDRDPFALVAAGHAADIGNTNVLSTVFQGKEIYHP